MEYKKMGNTGVSGNSCFTPESAWNIAWCSRCRVEVATRGRIATCGGCGSELEADKPSSYGVWGKKQHEYNMEQQEVKRNIKKGVCNGADDNGIII